MSAAHTPKTASTSTPPLGARDGAAGPLAGPGRSTSDYWCEPCGADRALCTCLRYDEIVSLRAEKRDELAHEFVS